MTMSHSQGYLTVSDVSDVHYFAWLTESRNDPSTDPVIVWFSGGPGCSSSLAMLSENGPCLGNSDGSGTTYNKYGWNNNATLMYVDQPAGVGFSYGDMSGYSHNESQVAAHMLVFFEQFYKNFPQYAKNPLYIAAESYGGHYGPSIAYALYTANKNGQGNFPLAGVAIGNGLVDPPNQYPTYPDFVENGCKAEIGKPCVDQSGYESMVQAVPTCSELISECQNDTSTCAEAQAYCNDAMFGPYEETGLNPYDIRIPCEVPPLCYDFSGITSFLNSASVQSAIGVNNIQWSSCNFQVNGMFDNDWMKSMAWKVPPMLEAGIKIWVYAGTDDFIVQWMGDKKWTTELQWSGQAKYNAAADVNWMSGGKVAGQHREFGGLSFTSVYNAGHMAPRDQPAATLTMINALIMGQPLPSE
jgi:cathepsin A (carboxypeptidase C)